MKVLWGWIAESPTSGGSVEVFLGLAAVAVVAGVLVLIISHRRRSRPTSIESARPLLHALALSRDGSFLIITHQPSDRFAQFYKERGPERTVTLVLDLPKAGANEGAFDGAAEVLKNRYSDLRRFSEPGTGADTSLEVLRVPVTAEHALAASEALEIAKQAFAAMDANAPDQYTLRSHGERDSHELSRASEENLRTVANLGIPVVSRLVRRELMKIEEDAEVESR